LCETLPTRPLVLRAMHAKAVTLVTQLEVTLDSLADLEQLWATLPPAAHAAWSQRARGVLLDGSPRWDVMRVCPVLPDTDSTATASTSAGQGSAVAVTTVSPAVSPPTPPLRVPRGVNPWKKGGPKPVRRGSS